MAGKKNVVIPIPQEPTPTKTKKKAAVVVEMTEGEKVAAEQAELEQAAAARTSQQTQPEAGAEFVQEPEEAKIHLPDQQLFRLQAPGSPEHQYPFPDEILDPAVLAHWKRQRVKEYCARFKVIAQQVQVIQ